MLKGEIGDYRTIAELMLSGGKADVPIHYLLGNHDNRDSFREVLRTYGASPIDSHVVAILDAGPVNWLMLDSLDKVNGTPGKLGEAQLAWLAAALDARADKPAIVSVHHNLVFPAAPDVKISGLTDTAALFEVLQPRKQVKAVIYGHTHNWALDQRDGIHLVNLPPVAYVFAKGRPNGWVSADVRPDGMTLTLNALDRKHADHGQKHELAWR
jgi:3',5'-cyclic AMP phosphodiesterase CpdA